MATASAQTSRDDVVSPGASTLVDEDAQSSPFFKEGGGDSPVKPSSISGGNSSSSDNDSPNSPTIPLPAALPLPPPPPDGGLVAWCQVASGFLVNAVGWGFPAMFGVYQLYYVTELGLPGTQVAWIGSVQTFLTYFFCVVSGRLADAGYVLSTVVVGTTLAVLGTVMTSLCREYWQIFLAQGICTGLGLGLVATPTMGVINMYFTTKRSVAIASSTIGTSVGSMVFPAVVQHLVPKVGFAWAVRSSALVALVMCVLAVALLRPLPTPRRTDPFIDAQAFREAPYVLFAVGSFLFFMAQYFAFFYMNIVAEDVAGMPPTVSVQLIIICSAMGIASRPLAGLAADRSRRYGPIETFVLCGAASGASLFGWIGARNPAGMYAFAVAFGLTNGAAQGIWPGALVRLTTDPARFGTRYGMMCALGGLATLAGPPAAAAIVEAGLRAGVGYVPAQAWCAAVTVLGSGAAMVAGVLVRRRRGDASTSGRDMTEKKVEGLGECLGRV